MGDGDGSDGTVLLMARAPGLVEDVDDCDAGAAMPDSPIHVMTAPLARQMESAAAKVGRSIRHRREIRGVGANASGDERAGVELDARA